MLGTEPLVLLIEDEPQMRRFLRITLRSQGFRLVEAETAHDGLLQAATHSPEIILLDLGLPDMDGLEVIRRIREWSAMPIIVLSAREQEKEKVRSLDGGADDYLTKPFGTGELLARMRVALRHRRIHDGQVEPVFIQGELKVDLVNRRVFVGDSEIHLTPTEYRLLSLLVHHAGKVLTHRYLLQDVWGKAFVTQTQYLRVYMAQLRRKIEVDPARPRYLINEPGVGYRFKVEEDPPEDPPPSG